MFFAMTAMAGAPAGCPFEFHRKDLNAFHRAAQLAIADFDYESLGKATLGMRDGIPCATFRLTAADLAPVYRLNGWSFLAQNDEQAVPWLAAAGGLAPAHRFDPPLDGPKLAAWKSAEALWQRSIRRALPDVYSATLVVDGIISDSAPLDLPWTLQVLDGEGSVARSSLVGPNDGFPEFPEGRGALHELKTVETLPTMNSSVRVRHGSRGLLGAGLTFAALDLPG